MTGIEKMQIESNHSYIQFPLDPSTDLPKQADQTSRQDADHIEFSAAYQKFIKHALAQDQDSSQKILDARAALEKGELDSPQSARLAAESLLQYGI